MENNVENIAFIGDIALLSSGSIPNVSNVKHLFADCDIVFANLECTLKGNGFPNPSDKDAVLSTTMEHLTILKELGVNVVNLGNNHIFDYGLEGFNETTNYLKQESIAYLGAGENSYEAAKQLYIDVNGIRICFLSYVTFDTHPQISNDTQFGVNMFVPGKVLSDINRCSPESDFLVVSLHWGAERYHYPTPGQIKYARKMIDAGTDLIIGHHSHFLQGMECYKGKYIFYNLGNFFFPHIYNNGKMIVKQKVDNFETVVPKLKISKKKIESIKILPSVYSHDGVISVANQNIINKVHRYSKYFDKKYYSSFWYLYKFYMELYKDNWLFILLRGESIEEKYKNVSFLNLVGRVRLRHIKQLFYDILKLSKPKCDI